MTSDPRDPSDDDLAPLPGDFHIPDDASALEHDRDAHRLSGLPRLDRIISMSIFAAILAFASVFAMYGGVMSRTARCSTEAECAEQMLPLLSSIILIFTPVVVAALIVIGNIRAIPRRGRLVILAAGMIFPIAMVVTFYAIM